MGLKTFINNIRYLARYNIKEMNNNIEAGVQLKDVKKIMHLLPYIEHNNKIDIKIKNIDETIDELVRTEKSMVRYGDGEYTIMNGKDILFQRYNSKLSSRLHEIYNNSNNNILIGISSLYYKIELDKYLDSIYDFIFSYVAKEHNRLLSMISANKEYISAEITQIYQLYKEYDFDNYFNKIKKIWENKEIVIVCGETVFNNIEYNIFENSKSIDYIYAPSKNAYDKYSEILKQSLQYDKNKLFIIILGPTANILAYDLANNGYRALDFGHIAKDYDAYIKKLERNHKNIMNFFKPD